MCNLWQNRHTATGISLKRLIVRFQQTLYFQVIKLIHYSLVIIIYTITLLSFCSSFNILENITVQLPAPQGLMASSSWHAHANQEIATLTEFQIEGPDESHLFEAAFGVDFFG